MAHSAHSLVQSLNHLGAIAPEAPGRPGPPGSRSTRVAVQVCVEHVNGSGPSVVPNTTEGFELER
jgi:hypothetical protein